jgi:peptidoglycan/LPS O-acetylase OafA/YrhL
MRILPAYWLTVVVCLSVLPQNDNARLADWVHNVTLTQIYQPALLRHGLTQTWSLATEVAFYLVLPLAALAALGRRWRPVRAVAICLASAAVTGAWIAAMALGYLATSLHTMWLPAYAIWFGAGMALAVVHVALATGTAPARWRLLHDIGAAPLACWGLALGLLVIASTPLVGPRNLVAPTAGEFALKVALYVVIAALVLVPVAFGPENGVKTALRGGLAHWFGAISYGLFLWHPFVIDVTYWVTGWPVFTGDYLVVFSIALVGATMLAALSWYALERPLQRWAARRWNRPGRTTESQRATAMASAAS